MITAVVIPSYRVKNHILGVLSAIGPEVNRIYVVDDCCPEETGEYVAGHCRDPRVRVIRHSENQGVGGATITGFMAALADGVNVVVKIDGDGQMDPSLIPRFLHPIKIGAADYVKGNRFFDLESLSSMPKVRLIGNAGLSFISKFSSGYWDIMDPTNGFFAIHAEVLALLPLRKLDKRYFFESDLLFRLNTIRAVVYDLPMSARYADETSSLRVSKVLLEFPRKHLSRAIKRFVYNYWIRDFNLGTIQFSVGLLLTVSGSLFGAYKWQESVFMERPATAGTVMLATLPIILGFQLLLSALQYEVNNVPTKPLHQSE